MKHITITDDHLKLLRKLNFYCKDGVPGVSKRQPYLTTCIECDVAKILEIKPKFNSEMKKCEFTNEQKEYMAKIHKETTETLQVAIQFGEFLTGTFEQKHFGRWRRVS